LHKGDYGVESLKIHFLPCCSPDNSPAIWALVFFVIRLILDVGLYTSVLTSGRTSRGHTGRRLRFRGDRRVSSSKVQETPAYLSFPNSYSDTKLPYQLTRVRNGRLCMMLVSEIVALVILCRLAVRNFPNDPSIVEIG
ncbi:unnamed protein product, partial [Ectocarpus sp. 12 AP-2014]